MRRLLLMIIIALFVAGAVRAQNVTIHVVDRPAAEVFRQLVVQTGKNFVYSSDILDGVRITLTATDRPLKKVLSYMFENTGIEFRIKGDNVMLRRKDRPRKVKPARASYAGHLPSVGIVPHPGTRLLDEVTVESRLEAPQTRTVEIGARKVTADEVLRTPAMLGEADVIKSLHSEPGVTEGVHGLAGMYVHGGNADENLYLFDNVPLYQVNHFAGLFSAFNPDIIRYIDFYKSSMPAKYDGRLSSVMDVRLQNGNPDGHHGSTRIGLTSGAFNLSGPIGRNTTYLVGLRRSWFDVFTIPALAVINNKATDEHIRFHYYFMDLNARVTHRFSEKASAFASVYFGDDYIREGTKDTYEGTFTGSVDDILNHFHWGNILVQTGMNYRMDTDLSAEFTAAYTRYFSSLKHREEHKTSNGESVFTMEDVLKTDNHIDDWILRGDFDWTAADNSRVRFGASYTRHSFLPARTTRILTADDLRNEASDSTWSYGANELNAYIEDDIHLGENFRINAGLHGSLFHIDGKLKGGLSPRLSLACRLHPDITLKAAYSRTVQYVHQLISSSLSLPTDQWIPVTGDFKPSTADKIAAGAYWLAPSGSYAASVEGYFKWMHNILDYRDEYYLRPPLEMWNARLTQGRGTARGVDVKIEKLTGRITGHVAYSLAWADRTFPDKNGGHTYPARFDNRHTINVAIGWDVSRKVRLDAVWTGHSGNRFTLLPQDWVAPSYSIDHWYEDHSVPLRAPINNYQLPFYHRLDLSCTVRNSRGYWSFGLYNAYNHMNTLAVEPGYTDEHIIDAAGEVQVVSRPVYRKIKIIPIIPSISYTWQF